VGPLQEERGCGAALEVVLGGSGVSLTERCLPVLGIVRRLRSVLNQEMSACLRNRKILIECKSSVLNCDLE
jgi:hypothetical protein